MPELAQVLVFMRLGFGKASIYQQFHAGIPENTGIETIPDARHPKVWSWSASWNQQRNARLTAVN